MNALVQDINITQHTNLGIKIAYAGTKLRDLILPDLALNFTIHNDSDYNSLNAYLNEQSLVTLPDVILMEVDEDEKWESAIKKIRKNPLLQGLIIILIADQKRQDWKNKALSLKVHDLYVYPFPIIDLCERLNFLVKFKLIKPQLSQLSQKVDVTYRLPGYKRVFDVLASGLALLFLSPFFLIVAAVIRLESKGPIIYKSKRVGTGYKIFDFYKFRSMRVDADKQLETLSTLNQYSDTDEPGKSAFIKIKNDPRITRVGSFLRNTSIDELPQLFNVFKGDMSLVGNRPLPLYEAEMLTSNEWSMRFLGPAGLTGLWQISKRGKEEMSERERKRLDNFYATNYSFWLDMKIIAGTIPALFQKEKV